MLTRLAKPREEVAMFLESKSDLATYLRDKEFILRLTYLADIFSRLNELNLYLQGTEGISVFAVHDRIRGFMKKLFLWKNCITNVCNNSIIERYKKQTHPSYTPHRNCDFK